MKFTVLHCSLPRWYLAIAVPHSPPSDLQIQPLVNSQSDGWDVNIYREKYSTKPNCLCCDLIVAQDLYATSSAMPIALLVFLAGTSQIFVTQIVPSPCVLTNKQNPCLT